MDYSIGFARKQNYREFNLKSAWLSAATAQKEEAPVTAEEENSHNNVSIEEVNVSNLENREPPARYFKNNYENNQKMKKLSQNYPTYCGFFFHLAFISIFIVDQNNEK